MPKPRKQGTRSRNPTLTKGVTKLGRSASWHLSGRYKVKNLKGAAKAAPVAPKTKEVTFGKGKRTVPIQKTSAHYPTEDVGRPLYVRKPVRPAHVRRSLQPGTVAILLAGRARGKRVVVLRSLPSGLLLVTGPFKINGVPLRRVNPAYVIATSTKVDLGGVKLDAKLDDHYFKRPETKAEGKHTVDATRKADQKAVDAGVLAIVKKTPQLADYLSAKFSLTNGQHPHELKW